VTSPSTDPLVGTTIGQYQVLVKIGGGGMGLVYKARDTRLGRTVALKFLPPEWSHDDTAKQRIVREAQAASATDHPNICTIHDIASTPDGRLFIVMAYYQGQTLKQRLASGRLPIEQAIDIARQVATGLAHAHAQGIVHRDIKPGNLILGEHAVKIVDFGLAKVADSLQLTTAGAVLGTVAYMSPEQVRGDDVDARTDVWATGVVLYEMLAGQQPFRGGYAEAIGHAIKNDVPRPLRDLRPDVPEEIEQIVFRALHKDPAVRFSSGRELAQALQAAADRGAGSSHTATLVRSQAASPAASSSSRDAGPLSTSGPERRHLTVLACEVFANRLADGVDDEDLHEALLRLRQICTSASEKSGGYVAREGRGSASITYFGYPTAGEDDAATAARAALTIVGEVKNAAGELRARGIDGVISLGLHSGTITARPAGAADGVVLVGEAELVAVQLASMADSNAIVLTEATRRLLRNRFECESIGVRTLRGTTQPLPVYRLADAGHESLAARPLSGQTEFVGRLETTQLLRECWRKAVRGNGQLVLLTGEPGIGKSRLLREVQKDLAQEPHSWFQATCLREYQNQPLAPVVSLLQGLMPPAEGEDAGERWDQLRTLVDTDGPDGGHDLALLGALLSLPAIDWLPAPAQEAPLRRQNTFKAVARLFTRAAARQPIVVAFEDLHWADPSTIEFLGPLAEATIGSAVLVLLTARSDFHPPQTPGSLLFVRLPPLPTENVESIIRGTARRELPGDLVAAVVSRSGGNPLFAEELTRMIVESPELVERGDRFVLRQPSARPAIPLTLHGSLLARLDRLGATKRTVQIASVIGRQFDLTLLAAACGASVAELHEHMERLSAADLVYRVGRSRHETFVFRHPLVQEVAYDSLVREERREFHRAIALALELGTEGGPAPAHLLALHFAEAGEHVRAVRYGVQAAQDSLMQSAYLETIELARHALAWIPSLPADQRDNRELEIRGLLVPALMATRGYGSADVEASLAQSLAIVNRLGANVHTFPTRWAIWSYYQLRGQYDDALAMANANLQIASESGDSGLEVEALLSLAIAHWYQGHFGDAISGFERVEALFDEAAHAHHAFIYGTDPRRMAQAYRSLAMWHVGRPRDALAVATECAAAAEREGHGNTTGLALMFLGVLHQYNRDAVAVAAVALRLTELSARHGLLQWLSLGLMLRHWAAVANGAMDVTPLSNGVAMYENLGARMAITYWRSLLGDALARLGVLDMALTEIGRCIEAAHSNGEAFHLVELLRMKGGWLWQSGASAEGAEACYRDALEVAARQGALLPELRTAVDYGRLLVETRRTEAAADLLTRVLERYPGGSDDADFVAAEQLSASLIS
jgi:TOMM system kinase/cyclase fusion protein